MRQVSFALLLEALASESPVIQREAGEGIRQIPPRVALKGLLKLSESKDARFRQPPLKPSGGPGGPPLLVGATVLGRPLILLLNDKENKVQISAARALGNFKGEEVLFALKWALDDRSERVKIAAAASIIKILNTNFTK